MKKQNHLFSLPALLPALLITVTLATNDLAMSVAQAASSQWQELGGGQARLVARKNPVNGKLDGVIEVRLNQGWKTYWKSPGGSGIAPEFDFSRSSDVKIEPVAFPVPSWIKLPDTSFYGYKDKVSFPFSGIAGSSGADINLDMLLGVCEEICIPAMASFRISADELNRSDPKADILIALAQSRLPGKPSGDYQLTSAKLEGETLRVSGDGDRENLPKVVISVPGIWVSDPEPAENNPVGGFTVSFPIPDFVAKETVNNSVFAYTLLEHDSENGKLARVIDGEIRVEMNAE